MSDVSLVTSAPRSEYVQYLIDNKERISQEFKLREEFRMSEEVRIREEYPQLSDIEKVAKLADAWRDYTETIEYKSALEMALNSI